MPQDQEIVSVPIAVLNGLGWFFQNSKDVFIAIHEGRLERTNPVWTRLTGFDAGACEGKPFRDFVAAADRERVENAFAALGPLETADIDLRLSTSAGDELWTQASAVSGKLGWILAILRDVTAERRRAEEQEESRRIAGLITASAGVNVWRYNPDLDLYEINPDFSHLPSRRPGLTTGRTTRFSIHPQDGLRLDQAWKRSLQTGEPGHATYRRRADGGAWRHLRVAWQGSRRLASGRWEMLGVAQDVTELIDARDAAQAGERAALGAAEAKSRFLANISHELRTPMNGVLGVLHLLKSEPRRAERGRMIEEGLAAGVGLSDLLSDLVDYSDLETGQIELEPRSIDPGAQLRSVAALMEARARGKGLSLEVVIEPDLGRITADPARLRKMLFHLIDNAVKFTASGGVEARLGAGGEGQTRRLRFEVADTGIGLSLADQLGLFERFSQADASMTRRYGGAGLGLAVTSRLAKLMGGSVGFSSREGEGSTFWIEIPAPATNAADAEAQGSDWLAGVRVLVVEDNPTNRLVATRMLAMLGAVVQTAEDGAQGVAAVETADFDLVFMDIQMPVMDGVEATRRIRAMPAPKSGTPIVATTANVMPEQLRAYRQCGIDGVVAKPISPAALIAEVSRLAEKSAAAPTAPPRVRPGKMA